MLRAQVVKRLLLLVGKSRYADIRFRSLKNLGWISNGLGVLIIAVNVISFWIDCSISQCVQKFQSIPSCFGYSGLLRLEHSSFQSFWPCFRKKRSNFAVIFSPLLLPLGVEIRGIRVYELPNQIGGLKRDNVYECDLIIPICVLNHVLLIDLFWFTL